jgi:hypothetical protein
VRVARAGLLKKARDLPPFRCQTLAPPAACFSGEYHPCFNQLRNNRAGWLQELSPFSCQVRRCPHGGVIAYAASKCKTVVTEYKVISTTSPALVTLSVSLNPDSRAVRRNRAAMTDAKAISVAAAAAAL